MLLLSHCRTALIGLFAFAVTGLPAMAQVVPQVVPPAPGTLPLGATDPSPASTCNPGPVVALRVPKAAAALAGKRALTIVAIGSSSTAGVGATSAAATYPAILQANLQARFPGREIRVINKGGNGEDVPENLARFERDVRDLNPDLVLWQMGTNYVIRGGNLTTFGAQLRQGIDLIQSWGADAVLIDLQYSPWVNGNSNTPAINALIASTARSANASTFPRYTLMRNWVEQQKVPMSQTLFIDGLHMNNWSYNCFALSLAQSLAAGLGARAAAN